MNETKKNSLFLNKENTKNTKTQAHLIVKYLCFKLDVSSVTRMSFQANEVTID